MTTTSSDIVPPTSLDDDVDAARQLVERLDRLSLGEALAVLHRGLETISVRTSTPDAMAEFARFRGAGTAEEAGAGETNSTAAAADAPVVDGDRRCTLPSLLESTQRLAAVVAGVQARLDGFTADAFHSTRDRAELLGLPSQGKLGYRDPREFLQDATNISRFEANRRARQAEDFRPHDSGAPQGATNSLPSGRDTVGRLGALMPRVAAGFAASRIDPGRLGLLRSAIDRVEKQARTAGVPDQVIDQMIRDADEHLASAASEATYDEFRAAVKRWSLVTLRAVSEDPVTSAEKQAEEQRSMTYLGQRGALHDWMISTPQDGHEALRALQSAATNPRRPQAVANADDSLPLDDSLLADDAEGADGGDAPIEPNDGRSREQRLHDAFFGILTAGWTATENGSVAPAGTGPQLIVTAGIATLLRMAHRDGLLDEEFDPELLAGATTEDLMVSAGFSGDAGAGVLRRMLCTADITPVVLGTASEVLDVGRKYRLFTPAQRRGLIARDGGCAAPGCTFPAAWCEAHHIDEWSQGGVTSIENGVLLCSHHHHAVHEGMWKIEMVDHVPWFTATGKLNSLERDRSPRRNGYWKPDRGGRKDQSASAADPPALFPASEAEASPPAA